jgi:hypothetical protein
LKLLKSLKVKRYILLESMYDVVPHTKPLMMNGGSEMEEILWKIMGKDLRKA